MKPVNKSNTNNAGMNNSSQTDVDFYIRKAHQLRSEAFRVCFTKLKKQSANGDDPKPTVPRAA